MGRQHSVTYFVVCTDNPLYRIMFVCFFLLLFLVISWFTLFVIIIFSKQTRNYEFGIQKSFCVCIRYHSYV